MGTFNQPLLHAHSSPYEDNGRRDTYYSDLQPNLLWYPVTKKKIGPLRCPRSKTKTDLGTKRKHVTVIQ